VANLKYLLIRVALFAVVLTICLLLKIGVVLGAVFAALISFCLGYLFFSRQRDSAATQLAGTFGGRTRNGRAEKDAEAEDAVVDGSAKPAYEQPVDPTA